MSLEIGWQRLFASCDLLSQSFIVRYVDNRFIITSREFADSLAIRTLVSPLFYGAPIELEDVGDDHFFWDFVFLLTNDKPTIYLFLIGGK